MSLLKLLLFLHEVSGVSTLGLPDLESNSLVFLKEAKAMFYLLSMTWLEK